MSCGGVDCVPYTGIKIVPRPAKCTFVLQKNFIAANAVKVTISSLCTQDKNGVIKCSPMRAGGEIGEHFLLAKFLHIHPQCMHKGYGSRSVCCVSVFLLPC